MPKKFINPNWKDLRKLDARLRQAYFYCWDKADAIGVYEVDSDYMKLEIGSSFNATELSALPNAVKISADKIIFTDYILVNYVVLKQDYNPHKPAFRALTYHKLNLHSSFTQVCIKVTTNLEDEEEDKEEDKDKEEKGKGGVGEKGLMLSRSDEYSELLQIINTLTGRQFRGDSKSQKQFAARIKQGWTMDQFRKAIENATANQYHIESNFQYITPEFITREDKLDKFNAGTSNVQSSNRRIVGKTTEQDIKNNFEHFKQLWAQTKNNENQ